MDWSRSNERELRPLGIGEVLDRAVTLSVRYFVPLAVVYVVIAVPQGILRYFAGQSLTRFMTIFASQMQTRGTLGRPADPSLLAHQLAAASPPSGWVVFVWLFAFGDQPARGRGSHRNEQRRLSRPFGRSFGDAYRVAFARYVSLLGVNLIFIVAAIFLYVVVVLVVVLLAFGVGSLYVFSHPLGFAIGIPLGLAFLLVSIAFAVVIALALQVAYFTCVIERASSARAFSLAVSRVFGKIGLPRALLFGAAYLAISLVLYLVALAGELALTSFLHSEAAAAAYVAVVGIVSAIFATAFVCVFYYDLRVREEGYDLQLAAANVLR